MHHPEVGGDLGRVLEEFGQQELVDVFCLGCNGFVKMNSAYARYLKGEISSCSCCSSKLKEFRADRFGK